MKCEFILKMKRPKCLCRFLFHSAIFSLSFFLTNRLRKKVFHTFLRRRSGQLWIAGNSGMGKNWLKNSCRVLSRVSLFKIDVTFRESLHAKFSEILDLLTWLFRIFFRAFFIRWRIWDLYRVTRWILHRILTRLSYACVHDSIGINYFKF